MSERTFIKGKTGKLADAVLNCGCGQAHALGTRQILTLGNAAGAIKFYIRQYGGPAYFLVQRSAAGICAEEIATRIPQGLRNGISPVDGRSLAECGEIAKSIPGGTSALVAVGGRDACQSAKYLSAELGLPMILVAVIADDDDMLSSRSVLKQGRRNGVFGGKAPEAVFVSLKQALKFTESGESAAGLICSNLLLCFESMFNRASGSIGGCGVTDAMIKQAVKEYASNARRPLGKRQLSAAFNSLLRISAAKAAAPPGAYDTSFAAVCDLIEAETGAGRGTAAGAVYGAAAGCFELVLNNYDLLTAPEAFEEAGAEYEAQGGVKPFSYSLDGIERNIEDLQHELGLISKMRTLVEFSGEGGSAVTGKILRNAINGAGACGCRGVFAYGLESGLLG